MRKYTFFICIMTVIMAVLAGCINKPTEEMLESSLPQQEKKVIVETDVITQGDLYSKKRISGQVKSMEESEVYTNFGGRVLRMTVREGQVVEKGQVIAQLDSDEQQTAVSQFNDVADQAQISVNQAIQQLQNAENAKLQASKRHELVKKNFTRLEEKYSESQTLQDGSEESTIQKIGFAELKSQWDITIKNLEKSSKLFEEGLIAQKELEQAQTQEDGARRSYEKALLSAKEDSKELANTIENDKINLLISEMELKQADVVIEQAKITLAQAKNSAQQAEKTAAKSKSKLNDSTIHAPFTGVVKKIHVNEGGYAAQHAPLVTMYNHQQLKIVASVYPSQKNDFFKGQRLKIAGVNDEPDNEGEIIHISPFVDEKGFFQIEAMIKENQKNYIDGEYTELVVEIIAEENQLLIPTKAIIENDEKAFIYVIKDSQAFYKEIEVLQMQEEWTSVKGDIQPGEEVAVKGLILLSDGLNVQVVDKNKPVEKTVNPVKDEEQKNEKDKVDSSKVKDGEPK